MAGFRLLHRVTRIGSSLDGVAVQGQVSGSHPIPSSIRVGVVENDFQPGGAGRDHDTAEVGPPAVVVLVDGGARPAQPRLARGVADAVKIVAGAEVPGICPGDVGVDAAVPPDRVVEVEPPADLCGAGGRVEGEPGYSVTGRGARPASLCIVAAGVTPVTGLCGPESRGPRSPLGGTSRPHDDRAIRDGRHVVRDRRGTGGGQGDDPGARNPISAPRLPDSSRIAFLSLGAHGRGGGRLLCRCHREGVNRGRTIRTAGMQASPGAGRQHEGHLPPRHPTGAACGGRRFPS